MMIIDVMMSMVMMNLVNCCPSVGMRIDSGRGCDDFFIIVMWWIVDDPRSL